MKVKIFLLLFIVLSVACSKNEPVQTACEEIIVPFTSLEAEYGCKNTPYETDIDLRDTYTVIRTQDEFNALVIGSCTRTIDFSTYDLIIGKKGLQNGNISISYQLIENCVTNALTLTVTFLQNETLEAPNLTYHVLTAKIADVEALEVEIIETN